MKTDVLGDLCGDTNFAYYGSPSSLGRQEDNDYLFSIGLSEGAYELVVKVWYGDHSDQSAMLTLPVSVVDPCKTGVFNTPFVGYAND